MRPRTKLIQLGVPNEYSPQKVTHAAQLLPRVKAAALRNIDLVLTQWLPNGKRVDGGKEYTAPNPTRTDKRAGSLKINLSKGTWADFATGDKGGDLIDLVRYLDGSTDVEACNKLVDLLRLRLWRFAIKTSTD